MQLATSLDNGSRIGRLGTSVTWGLSGATDQAIFQRAQSDHFIVVTFDEDFAAARMFPVGSHAGVIRLRVWPTTVENTQAALARLLESVPEEDLSGSLVIVDDSKIRVKRSARHG
ncbi:MAG: DUF5615 family PIN-like protein [Bryobacteraceae bacterium]|nr:DUF5615 family PIN-like protein [Bryobacteraceae bacterium]